MIDTDTLRKLIDYDPDTGALTWKRRTAELHPNDQARRTFNARYDGKIAFTSDDAGGYKIGTIFGSTQKAHRVAYAIFHGSWPRGEVDHINGIKDDNRILNLRDVTKSENMKNAALSKRNTSGHAGVWWDKSRNKWLANICDNSKMINLGRFADKEDAIAARNAAEKKLGYHENHGREST
jgi:hypothetical protein